MKCQFSPEYTNIDRANKNNDCVNKNIDRENKNNDSVNENID
jgi:hypothetical protein